MNSNKSEIRIMHSDRGLYEIKYPEGTVLGFLDNSDDTFTDVPIPHSEPLVTSSRTEKYRYYKYKANAMSGQCKIHRRETCKALERANALAVKVHDLEVEIMHLNSKHREDISWCHEFRLFNWRFRIFKD